MVAADSASLAKLSELSPEDAAERAAEVISEWQVGGDHRSLLEGLASIDRLLRLEDENWEYLYGRSNNDTGLDLEEIQEISEQIRNAIIKSPIIKRALRLRVSYTWSKGINLPNTKPDTKGKRGPASTEQNAQIAAHNAVMNPVNQTSLFSEQAHEELETLAFADGMVFALADNGTKEIRRIPLTDITAFVTNPDFPDEVWAFQREWSSVGIDGKAVGKKEWYYLDTYTGVKAKKIQDTPVNSAKTLLWLPFNRIGGWPLGVPDAVNVIAWAKLYSEFLKHGSVMSKALATFAFKATLPSKKSGETATMKIGAGTEPGSTAVMGGASDLTAMPTAGKGYDFSSGRALAAMVATGVEVSLIHLLSDPGAAGSSYGSASNLDMPTARAIVSRQALWAAFYKRVLAFLGVVDADVTFPNLDQPDIFREVQSLLAAFDSGLLHLDEVRPQLLELVQIVSKHDSEPDGAMLPNNSNSLDRADIDNDANPSAPAGVGSAAKGGVSRGQGKSPKTGGSSLGNGGKNANDIRTDGLTK